MEAGVDAIALDPCGAFVVPVLDGSSSVIELDRNERL
jgi:hypothetical protein